MTKTEMMTRAHEMTRACRLPGDDYRVTLAAALRIVWEQARSEQQTGAALARLAVATVLQAAEDAATRRAADTARAAADTAPQAEPRQAEQARSEQPQPETVGDFAALDGVAQLDLLRRFAARCPRYAQQQTRKSTDPETGETVRIPAPASWAQWMIPRSQGGLELEPWAVAVDTIASEAWIKLQAADPSEPFSRAARRAASAACARLSRLYRDAPRHHTTGAISDPVSLDDPDYTGAARYPSPEIAAMQQATIDAAAHDVTDRRIIASIAYGLSGKETAARLGLTPARISQRRAAMIARYRAAELDDLADAAALAAMQAAGIRAPRRPEWRPDGASSSPGQP